MIEAKDQHGNISFTYEENELNIQKIKDYWTQDRKDAARPIGQEVDLEGHGNEEEPATTDPEKADLSKMPFQAGGKLFFSCDGKDFVGSAQIVTGKKILLTAAHCIQDKDTGHLCDNFQFERGYDEDGKSTETLTFKTIALKSYWHEQKEWKWDYAFAILNGESLIFEPLTCSTENVGEKVLVAFGYPQNYYAGKKMVYVEGSSCVTKRNTREIKGNKMRQGSSGGAWVLKGTNTVVGNVSYGPVSEKAEDAYQGSPIYDAEFESLHRYVGTLL
ncbi:MAG: serine protease [Lachnospiraceae bacterium]|nr:serine protease [Lachnospiraceae bacterium]